MDKGQAPPYLPNPTTYSQPQAIYNQYPQGTSTIVIVPQSIPNYGPYPQPTTCPHCHKAITTRIETVANSRTHFMAFLCCIMCCLPCIPYCIDSCQNRNHYCPNCTAFLGSYNSDPWAGQPRYY